VALNPTRARCFSDRLSCSVFSIWGSMKSSSIQSPVFYSTAGKQPGWTGGQPHAFPPAQPPAASSICTSCSIHPHPLAAVGQGVLHQWWLQQFLWIRSHLAWRLTYSIYSNWTTKCSRMRWGTPEALWDFGGLSKLGDLGGSETALTPWLISTVCK